MLKSSRVVESSTAGTHRQSNSKQSTLIWLPIALPSSLLQAVQAGDCSEAVALIQASVNDTQVGVVRDCRGGGKQARAVPVALLLPSLQAMLQAIACCCCSQACPLS